MSSTTIRIEVARAETRLTLKLAVMDCANCGVIFAIPDDYDDRRRDDGHDFYCPNGHSLSYHAGDKAKIRKLEAQLEQQKNRAQFYADMEREQRDRADRTGRQLAATRGQVTKLRKRAVAGTCPFGCRRHFVNLERHVATRHPGQELEGEA